MIFFILYWWARYFAPSHLPTGLFPLSNRLEDDTGLECEFLLCQSNIPCNWRRSTVVPTRSSPTQFTSRSLCSGASMNTVRGLDYIAVTAVSHDMSPLCHADNCSHSNHGVTTLYINLLSSGSLLLLPLSVFPQCILTPASVKLSVVPYVEEAHCY